MPAPYRSPISAGVPHPGEGKRGEKGHIGYLLRQASGAFRLQMERALSEFGVTPPQFAVLTMLVAYPGISNADIARLSMLTPQTVSVIVANLERAELIERTPHQIHGRIQQISVTPDGKNLLARCKRRVDALEAGLIAGLSSEEEATVKRWLASVAVHGLGKG
ncbi:MAG TPA: MarR family transcriptional regulator [Noviherbaspirillum sp.]|uniref:MarR family winged helix-turn-helix transcriptional regulator n=1 Tax=Noviherbaspirillum sp. TaxID=1926288 RepID=UPI002B476E34|nr:MarR family transcriptional regulator [Noviherbaspirillum sp.]HJV85962.1 MarR family transcriptional regulator [Noviherbaspirillum sp.]